MEWVRALQLQNTARYHIPYNLNKEKYYIVYAHVHGTLQYLNKYVKNIIRVLRTMECSSMYPLYTQPARLSMYVCVQ